MFPRLTNVTKNMHFSPKTTVAIVATMSFVVGLGTYLGTTTISDEIRLQNAPRFISFEVKKGIFEAYIEDAAQVQLWEIATTTEEVKIAELTESENGKWSIRVPREPQFVEVYEVRAFDEYGRFLDRQTLQVSGPDAIYTYIWGPQEENIQEVALKEGLVYNDLKIILTDVFVDSRCPVDVQCIWEGEVDVGFEAETPRGSEKGNLRNDEVLLFDKYKIFIQEVMPEQKEGDLVIPQEEYVFVVRVVLNTEKLPMKRDIIEE